MIKRDHFPFTLTNSSGMGKSFAIAALCLSMGSPILAEQHTSRKNHAAPNQPAQEESVLVATRDAAPSTPASERAGSNPLAGGERDALEPISQSSDYRPDLATAADYEEDSASFGDALVKSARPTTVAEDDSTPAALPEADAKVLRTEDKTDKRPSSGSARRAAAAHSHVPSFEPVKFQGISVGKTSKQELITAWGDAIDTTPTDDGEVLTYNKSPFKSVEALIGAKDIVSSIKITLATPIEAKQLAEQLSLDRLDAVAVNDDADVTVCQAYPEKGVLFMFETAAPLAAVESADEEKDTDKSAASEQHNVLHVVLQPIDAHAFAYRAENRLHGPYAQNISDLKAAIAIDPEFGRAYWLLAKIYIATGQADLADAAAAEACDIEPKNASFQLCHAQSRELLGEYDDAVLAVRAVLDREDLAQIDRAQALHQMAHLASLGDHEIASKTIPFETKAIEIADKLATSKDSHERRAAKQLLVEAHVGIAEEVARQPFNEKVESLSQWITRASGLAEEFIANDHGSVELRLYIAEHVLGAFASFKPTLDPKPWVAEAEESAKTLLAQSNDEMWQQRVKWDLGIAYLNALRVEHTRRQTDSALKYGQLAIDNLAVGASSRQAVHSSEQMVGQLYFQMGAVYAVHKLDHTKAVSWYEKAAPLLTNKRPPSELYAPRREGEMLVSMGVSYWQLGKQTQAIDLTQTGVGLVEAAVENGIVAKSTLAVPYNNLSTMYQQMGENTNAAKYAELAKSVGSADSKGQSQQQRVGRGQAIRSRTR